MSRFFGFILALVLAIPGTGETVPVTGRVVRAAASSGGEVSVSRYRERVSRSADAPEGQACECNPGQFAVVHLTGRNLPKPAIPMQPPAMAQKDGRFVPSVLAIPVGGTVSFPNRDPIFHNVFSYSKVRKFDLGRYGEGDAESVVFEEPGIVPIFCEIHYSMRAYVHVFESPYFAVSDESRRFEIPDVPPGDYELHVWQENLPAITIPVRVEDEPLHLEIP